MVAFSHRNSLYTLKKIFRTAIVLAPFLTNAKYEAQRLGRRIAGIPHEKDFRVLALLKESKNEADFLFLDIGANRGQTIDSVRLYKDYFIISIEANPIIAQKLKDQRRRDSRLKVLTYAISNIEGETTLYMPKYRNYLFDGLASMIRSEAESWLDKSHIFAFKKKLLSIVEIKVPMTTLDSLRIAPDFIKIDVQGAELLVLQGGRRTLGEFKPMLLVELPSYENEGGFLAEFGYQAFFFEDGMFHRGISENHSNSFFLTIEHQANFPSSVFAEK